jgi:hypothetical protein
VKLALLVIGICAAVAVGWWTGEHVMTWLMR